MTPATFEEPQIAAPAASKWSLRPFLPVALILALVFSIFYGFYLQGIPYEQEGALRGWAKATETSWPKMLGYLFRPFSVGATANNDTLIQTRVTESLILKGLHQLFGDSMTMITVYNLILVVVFASLVLWFAYQWAASLVAACLVAVFLLTTPAYGWSVMEYGDFSPLDQILLLCYLGFFITLFQESLRESSESLSWKKILPLVGLWLLGILTVKAKEPNKFLVPGLSWLLILFNPSGNLFRSSRRIKIYGLIPLCLVLILLSLPAVWVQGPAPKLFSARQLRDPFYIFFCNPFGYEPEKRSALFSLKNAFPSSIVSNFGFFLSWSAMLAALLLGIRKLKSKWNKTSGASVSIPFLLAGWTLLALAFHAIFKSLEFTRYLTWSLLPFAILIACLFTAVVNPFSLKTKKFAAGLVILFLVLKVGDNLQHSLYVRKGLERIWVPKWDFRTEVYKDQTGNKKPGLFEMYRYWFPRTDFTRAIEPYLGHEEARGELAKDAVFAEILKKFGVAYVASNRPLKLPWKAELIKELNPANFSLLSSLKYKFSKKKPNHYHLYRVKPWDFP